jgi:hypothetical protein
MTAYGFVIIHALVTDIDPAAMVKEAMNEINAARRLRVAALEKVSGSWGGCRCIHAFISPMLASLSAPLPPSLSHPCLLDPPLCRLKLPR